MGSSLKKFLDQFLNFQVLGKKVVIPYWMNKLEKKIYGPFGGKGTPEEILKATFAAAKKEKADLEKLDSGEIYLLMKRNRIGLDCSGFAFQILDFLDRERGGDGISDDVVGVDGGGIRKTNAEALTNDFNTVPVGETEEIKIGDLMRFSEGKHVAVVVGVRENEITYAHISGFTRIEGPHLVKIKVANRENFLFRRLRIWV